MNYSNAVLNNRLHRLERIVDQLTEQVDALEKRLQAKITLEAMQGGT